jgi:RHS repeat-associated protein
VSPYSYNTSNELTSTSAASYAYDYNGNTTSKTVSGNTTNYAWDYENRLTSVTLPNSGGTVAFKYDPFGRRIEKISPTTTSIFAYDGNNLVETVNSSGAVVARYVQGRNVDEPLAVQRGTIVNYYEADGLGSITSLTDTTGALAQTYTYDSYGNQTASSGSLRNFLRYTALEFDAEANLYYDRARYDDPSAGRFLSEDWARFWSGTNFYQYALNAPVNYIDPSGLRPQPGKDSWYDWWGWGWVPGVDVARCSIWSHYCWKVVTEKMQALNRNPYLFSNDDLQSFRGDQGQRQIQICAQGDDNCKRLEDNCGGAILGLIFKTGAFPHR